MSTTVFRTINPDLLIASKPFSRYGFLPVGGRSTFILLPSKDLFIVVSTPLDKETREAVLAFAGEDWESRISYLLAPNDTHAMYIKDWKKAFPSAKLIVSKTAEIPDAEHSTDAIPPVLSKAVSPYIKIQPFSQMKNHDLAVLYAAPSSSPTLIEADLLCNLPGKEQYSKQKAGWFGSLFVKGLNVDGLWAHKFLVSKLAGKGPGTIQTGKDASIVNRWDFARIIPCHGDVIEADGKRAWNKAYGALIAAANPKMGW